MNQIKKIIFNKIKELKLEVGHVLPKNKLYEGLNPKELENVKTKIIELVKENYLSEKNGGFELLQKGYNYIFKDYTLEDTEQLILLTLKNHNIKKGESVLFNFINRKSEWEKYFVDTFDDAIKSLTDKELFIKDDQNLLLTDLGYDKVYE